MLCKKAFIKISARFNAYSRISFINKVQTKDLKIEILLLLYFLRAKDFQHRIKFNPVDLQRRFNIDETSYRR